MFNNGINFKWFALLLLIGIVVLISFISKKQHPEDETNFTYTDGMMMIAGRSISLEIAADGDRQKKGLSGRNQIEENQGMLFSFTTPGLPVFWMKDMNFPIDIVWIKGAEVVDITPDIAPQPGLIEKDLKTYQPNKPADRVLELKAGWASRNGLKIGDLVEITQVVK